MKIELDDEIIALTGFSEREVTECLAVALYKLTGMHGAAAGRLLNISETEFHGLLEKCGCYINYGVKDFLEDVETLKRLEQDRSRS